MGFTLGTIYAYWVQLSPFQQKAGISSLQTLEIKVKIVCHKGLWSGG